MPHSCSISLKDVVVTKRIEELGKSSKLKEKWLKLILISEHHPRSSLYFKSKKAILREKIRHINSGFTHIIHPLSNFRRIYKVYRLFYYILVVCINPLDAAVTINHSTPVHLQISRIVDILSIIDIIISFFTGYLKSKAIELRPSQIAIRYMFGPFFIFDILGSSKIIVYAILQRRPQILIGLLKIFCLCRSIRIWTLLKLIYRIAISLHIKSKTTIFTFCSLVLFIFTLHFFTCFLIGSKIIIRYNFKAPDPYNTSNILVYDVYFDYMFRSSAYLLGIALPTKYFDEILYVEDYITTIFTYIIGKLLMISTWLIIALSILSTKSTHIKFQKILNEVDEYMIQKQLPPNLRKKIISYYNFRYQGSYFKEDLIQFILPENLRKDINVGICKALISSVSIFRYLNNEEVSEIVEALIPEIFLPNDFIIQAGTIGDCMYFIASGTVAVYSYSGKEICHLGDGSYFGEISLVIKDQKRSANISAIETSHIFRLSKADFQRTFMKHKRVSSKIIRTAENRLKHTLRIDEVYKKTLFEKAHADSISSPVFPKIA